MTLPSLVHLGTRPPQLDSPHNGTAPPARRTALRDVLDDATLRTLIFSFVAKTGRARAEVCAEVESWCQTVKGVCDEHDWRAACYAINVRTQLGESTWRRAFARACGPLDNDTIRPAVDLIMELSEYGDKAHPMHGPVEEWNVSGVTDLTGLFESRAWFRGDLSQWDVSNVTSLQSTFSKAQAFNCDLSKWNVSNVKSLANTFRLAFDFTSDLSKWDVRRVEVMNGAFFAATSFESDLSKWDPVRCTDMGEMFQGASKFDSRLPWADAVSNVENFDSAFMDAVAFRGEGLETWVTSSAKYMGSMFYGATLFNADMGDWDVNAVEDATEMVVGAAAFNSDSRTRTPPFSEEMQVEMREEGAEPYAIPSAQEIP